MFAKKRRGERRQSIIETIQQKYEIKSHLKFESFEEENKFLEGTGSMIFDRMNNIAYACKSVRTEETLLKEFCKTMNFEKVLFDAIDKNAVPIYYLKQKLEATGKEIIDISLKQMGEFAGNMIQLKNSNSEKFLIMSSRAYQSLTQTQLKYIQAKTNIIHSDLTTHAALFDTYFNATKAAKEHLEFQGLLEQNGATVYTVKEILLMHAVTKNGEPIEGEALEELKAFARSCVRINTTNDNNTPYQYFCYG